MKEPSGIKKVLMMLRGENVHCDPFLVLALVLKEKLPTRVKFLFASCIQKIELIYQFTASNLSAHMQSPHLRVFSSAEGTKQTNCCKVCRKQTGFVC